MTLLIPLLLRLTSLFERGRTEGERFPEELEYSDEPSPLAEEKES